MGQALLLLDPAKRVGFIAPAPVSDHYSFIICRDYFLRLLVPVSGPRLLDRGLVGVEGHQLGLLPAHPPISSV